MSAPSSPEAANSNASPSPPRSPVASIAAAPSASNLEDKRGSEPHSPTAESERDPTPRSTSKEDADQDLSSNKEDLNAHSTHTTAPDSAVLVPTSDAGQVQSQESLSEPSKPRKKIIKIIRKKRKPARPQVDPATFPTEPPPQTGTIFNIWYNKWSGGDREDKYLSNHKAPGRCQISKDSGYTRADSVPGSYFCLFFARGLCPKGSECEYLHRLPTVTDLFNPNVDCFGRDKFSDYRDDMGGVGSFLRQNRTIYVGRIHVSPDVEEVVSRHFQEWGDIERIRVLPNKGVAFVTYANEANSQFAKEAMAHQSLDHNEILNVRWATDDPNPAAQKRNAASLERQAAEAIRRALPAEYLAQIEAERSGGDGTGRPTKYLTGPGSGSQSRSRSGPGASSSGSGPKRVKYN